MDIVIEISYFLAAVLFILGLKRMSSPLTAPGQSAFTRTPYFPTSCANASVIPINAKLVALLSLFPRIVLGFLASAVGWK